MCAYLTLSYDRKYGYVIYCTKCKHLQLAFGCLMIHFRNEEFRSFRKVISEIMEDYCDCLESSVKTITIPTPCEGLSLFLSPSEVNVLHRIVEEADSNLCANELLCLFSRPA
ncbi:MAG TPA: hypothetical protein PK339_04455 [Flavitalea sp.]|nr:hypothetical protein [Flavitalea sp.]